MSDVEPRAAARLVYKALHTTLVPENDTEYRELLARFFLSLHDYQVAAVTPVDDDIVEIALEPVETGDGVGTIVRVRESLLDAATVADGLLRGPLALARA